MSATVIIVKRRKGTLTESFILQIQLLIIIYT